MPRRIIIRGTRSSTLIRVWRGSLVVKTAPERLFFWTDRSPPIVFWLAWSQFWELTSRLYWSVTVSMRRYDLSPDMHTFARNCQNGSWKRDSKKNFEWNPSATWLTRSSFGKWRWGPNGASSSDLMFLGVFPRGKNSGELRFCLTAMHQGQNP